jgi:hypothetical protein
MSSMTQLSVADAVRFLAERGVTRKPDTIRAWIHRGHLPAVKVFGMWRIKPRDLLHAERGVRQRTAATRRLDKPA